MYASNEEVALTLSSLDVGIIKTGTGVCPARPVHASKLPLNSVSGARGRKAFKLDPKRQPEAARPSKSANAGKRKTLLVQPFSKDRETKKPYLLETPTDLKRRPALLKTPEQPKRQKLQDISNSEKDQCMEASVPAEASERGSETAGNQTTGNHHCCCQRQCSPPEVREDSCHCTSKTVPLVLAPIMMPPSYGTLGVPYVIGQPMKLNKKVEI
ncbi:unnamed protein product, partial [Iphiclides podalirius]